ncbi:MAG: SAM-dependent methyltransferase [Lachnospiraceae bacterium]|nr:SAM-dependent methyltransferase [Lachnospiraceae bacterium]
MDDLTKVLDKELDNNLIKVIISGKRNQSVTADKVKIRPVIIKDNIEFQVTEYVGKKVLHTNYDKPNTVEYIKNNLTDNFKQCQIETTCKDVAVLVSKKGKVNISTKKKKTAVEQVDLSHNRSKKYLLSPDVKVDFLVDLGVMTKDGKIVNSKYDKFKQINRFLEFINDVIPELDRSRELTIIDFGCGKSYLTFAMYYFLKVLNGFDINVIGLDLKEDVIEHCNKLAQKYGYDKLMFLKGDIADYTGTDKADMVVTLHACDTATDFALEKAVKWNAKVILSVPCCQHEVNAQIKNEQLEPILKYGILKEHFSAIVTDALRAEILEHSGYDTQILEFIDMEHTPKNLLIRGIKRDTKNKADDSYKELIKELNINPTLDRLLK